MKIHLIGICGTGMGSLAGLLKAAGHDVRGSDSDVYPPMSTQLGEQGIAVMNGYRAENVDWSPDMVVVGNVCTKDHVEVVAAQARNLKLTSFPAVLEDLFLREGHALVVAGTHGKTTTSSLAAFVLTAAGRYPSFLVGGVPQNFGRSWQLGKSRGVFIVEGDEYDTAFFDKGSKFLHYQPKTAILTSVELDHVDIFDSLDAVKQAFIKFVALIPPEGLLVVAADSPGALEVAKTARCRVETYATQTDGTVAADWIGRPIATRPGGRTLFEVTQGGKRFGTFDTGLPGGYNLANALAVIAASADLGLNAEEIARGIRRFGGVKRRQETRGVAQGVTVVDDFAHHPTAVRETLRALRGRYGRGRLIAIFEPRSATSRRAVFQTEYADAFSGADEIIIGPVSHPEKAPPGDRFDPERLAADLRGRGVAARHLADVDKIVEQVVENAAAGDTVVVMSSGGFGGIHDKLLSRLGDAVVPASAEDLPGMKDVLDETGLSYPDMVEHLSEILVLRDPSRQVVGCVAMELYDDAGVLRALATRPSRRGEGLGWMLADAALGRARRRGARRVYLITEKASDFFAEKFGFQTVGRELVDAGVLESTQFRASTPNAVTMVLDLGA
ncbi:MAG TPA: UDP-N-acetylmuramate:L-alanyl-gamma-D-glutamyl-meso-diaminopimelate ligase [Kofleriaceae bacterium]|nr:UDP-N-acetylmuramate:L-alanyl-gamma-D-glutamyl-meso-diaminopimelate ligase [Kofleriaceae bacterium]